MKTSIKLLCLLAIISLTGMLSVDGLLKQQYDRIDWSNPYQNFVVNSLPALRHVRISGTPGFVIHLQQNAKSQALLDPDLTGHRFVTTQRGDTLLVVFKTKDNGWDGPIDKEWEYYRTALVLNLPALSSLSVNNVRVKVSGFETNQLSLIAHHARLITEKIRVSGTLSMQTENRAFAILNAYTCGTLRAIVRDSSGVQLDEIRPNRLITNVASGGELRIKGNQLGVMKP
ncbi:MAG: hypothetical protein LH609_01215 [Rudanella sp.]|nr:hypothetical protein [Rudanella sp.]